MRCLAILVAVMATLACGEGNDATSDAGPDLGGVDWGGDPGPVDTGVHPDVPAVLPADACDGGAPVVSFHHGFEPGEILPDDPTLLGFSVTAGGACPGDAGGSRALAWDSTRTEGAYAGLPDLDIPGDGLPWLSFCLVFDAHPGDQLRVEVLADAGDPETVWSSAIDEAATPHLVAVSLAPWAGQHARFSLHVSRGDEAAEPARDVRIDSLAVFSCPAE